VVFQWLLQHARGGPPDVDVAVPMVLRYVSCPYCGRAYPVMVLASLRSRVDPRPIVSDGGRSGVNPGFRESHLSNPIRCPYCGREYRVFAGVEYSPVSGSVRSVHVLVSRVEEPWVEAASRWPHTGLVKPSVLVYEPYTVTIYRDINHYREHNPDEDIRVTSLPSQNGILNLPSGAGEGYGPPQVVNVGMYVRRRLGGGLL